MTTTGKLPGWQREFSCFALGKPTGPPCAPETSSHKAVRFILNVIVGFGFPLAGTGILTLAGKIPPHEFVMFAEGLLFGGSLTIAFLLLFAPDRNPFRSSGTAKKR
jgi:hypothetical protein